LRVDSADRRSIGLRWTGMGEHLDLDVDFGAGRATISDDRGTREIASWAP
jgi:hypothetical protein